MQSIAMMIFVGRVLTLSAVDLPPAAINASSWTSSSTFHRKEGEKSAKELISTMKEVNSQNFSKSRSWTLHPHVSTQGMRFMWLDSVTVLGRRQRGWFSDTPLYYESGLPVVKPPQLDLLPWHRLALCCIYLRTTFYCNAHCVPFSHSDARDNASDLQTLPPSPMGLSLSCIAATVEIYRHYHAIHRPPPIRAFSVLSN